MLSCPKTPQDLIAHSCINLRLPTYGELWAWEFERNGRELKVRVDGPHVICHMASSVDGRILPNRWHPKGTQVSGLYKRAHEELKGWFGRGLGGMAGE